MEFGKKLRIGNYVLLKYKQDGNAFIKVSTISGEWSVIYRSDNKLFTLFDSLSEEEYESAGMFITSMYAVCGIIDAELTNDIILAVDKHIERLKKGSEEISQEEDQKILDDMKREIEMGDEMDSSEE